jgi:hypothetical protein
LISEKMAVFAPIPSASDKTATEVTIGVAAKCAKGEPKIPHTASLTGSF